MDSFKKGSNKINIPMAIRFNAHNDSVEDVAAPDDPVHPSSSSLPTSSSSTISSEPLSSSVGTWKIFKGRVSQAIGDKKSSKHSDSSNDSRKSKLTEESDSELPNENDAEKKKSNDPLKLASAKFEKCKNVKKHDSDKKSGSKDGEKKNKDKSDANGTDQENVLRRRRLDGQQASEQSDFDIESGVEITEEMTLSFYGPDNETVPSKSHTSSALPDQKGKINSSITGSSNAAKSFINQLIKFKTLHAGFFQLLKCYRLSISFTALFSLAFFSNDTSEFVKGFLFALFLLCLTVETFGLIRMRLAPLPRKNGFYYAGADENDPSQTSGLPCNHKLRNIQRSLSNDTRLITISSDDIFEHKHVLSYTGWMNEISKYDPLNYHSSMTKTVDVRLDGSMLRISSCAKHTPNKERIPRRAMWNEPFYNQQSALDDENVTSTKKKTKNKQWKHVNPALYSKHRYFELLNCTVALLPNGLARKRHFYKKYPIQLIIRQTAESVEKPEQKFELENIEQQNNESDEIDTTNALEMEQATVNFLEEEKLAIKKETNDEFVPKIEEIKKTTKFSKIKSIILFARCDREKEDWYRRFLAASQGKVYVTANSNIVNIVSQWNEIEHNEFPDLVMINSTDLNRSKDGSEKTLSREKSGKKGKKRKERRKKRVKKDNSKSSDEDWKWAFSSGSETDTSYSDKSEPEIVDTKSKSSAKGLRMSACASQGPDNYIKFMSVYQHFSKLTKILSDELNAPTEDGSVQESYVRSAFKYYFLSPKKAYCSTEKEEPILPAKTEILSTSADLPIKSDEVPHDQDQRDVDILWINVFLGRIIYSFLMNQQFIAWIHSTLQRKLDIIRLPVFMENIRINNINLGDTAPIFRNSQAPVCDERGLWFESDLTYRGLMHMTISVQLNLMRLKREEQHKSKVDSDKNDSSSEDSDSDEVPRNESKLNENDSESKDAVVIKTPKSDKKLTRHRLNTMQSICDSDAESMISSETDTESISRKSTATENSDLSDTEMKSPSGKKKKQGGKSRKILRIVDRITASNFFQSATELSYVQKAMKNMSKNIRLCVELKGVEGRVVFNIPPPPTDRLWISFRTPPKLLISATPAVGETTFDWDIVTSTIENKLYEEILKLLVYPNMIDIIIPALGEPTYKDPDELLRATTPPSP